jgi:hypothetical protein
MVHTYEVWVDIKECAEQLCTTFHNGTTRYEIDAESMQKAGGIACDQARSDYPRGAEYDARVTRLLR